ncbi:threonine--tRNA ligase, chloroplastic/mitochondrial 2-like isoform X1 [Pyrus x bretschneideri]|uniref:threonine--tRNA ligase, chloroplastic/mitochondrial 2-like isoform X1 n=1 Tax=Pyrus x bretschneideri TaxID=225117 RepID=UPI002030E7EB|nr:threonine--tRNA ligase, chloroplastic/mitochondrial 2-like isoform X1 [Pyrus x bretschneideri]XP_048439160.1 threonine--tRNA ligase, chloroplastic/mitochondrial 2-like isoform X1 [Pyrus x bretschneideri]XP_048439161.1 threonine--tRNA ligase, chloroplastic/mitochondrial 2-like isoform X1 [Pyrus x bretschneideri]XP_048439162.1 threonine--tRNA ligase, chloroplastic/mitochondrial 2-like isoform X1 [Pyrus x bretschneideri]
MATEAQVSTQDDKLKDAQMEVADKSEKVVLPTNESSENLIRIRHMCAHAMAMAVQKFFPDARVTIGPWIENGFYYDFDMEPLTDKELKRIKKEMVMNGGTYVRGPMLKKLEILTEKLSNLSLLLVPAGEEMKRNRCCTGPMALHGRVKIN